jgi:hypothetical protein
VESLSLQCGEIRAPDARAELIADKHAVAILLQTENGGLAAAVLIAA